MDKYKMFDEWWDREYTHLALAFKNKYDIREGFIAALSIMESKPETAGRTLAVKAPTTGRSTTCLGCYRDKSKNTTCLSCSRFTGERTDWYEK